MGHTFDHGIFLNEEGVCARDCTYGCLGLCKGGCDGCQGCSGDCTGGCW